METTENSVSINSILKKNYITNEQWFELIYQYDKMNDAFTQKMKRNYDNLTANDIQILVLTKLTYKNREIAQLRNVTLAGVKKAKQRLLKKLKITRFSELND